MPFAFLENLESIPVHSGSELAHCRTTAQPHNRGCAPILLVEVVFFLFWPDNLNEYRHSDRRHCEPTTARSGVAPGRAVPSDRESRRFSPGHHFRELSQMR